MEYILGVSIKEGGKEINVNPNLLGLTDIEAELPIKDRMVKISIHGNDIQIES